ncbi:MAG: hypothetical protein ACREIC_27760, partial [Limisphaerales bacterium]
MDAGRFGLGVFQNGDTLECVGAGRPCVANAATAREAAQTTLALAQKQVEAGYAGYLSLLTALQTY